MTGQIPCGANPGEDWMSPVSWELLNALEVLVKGPFDGFMQSFNNNVVSGDPTHAYNCAYTTSWKHTHAPAQVFYVNF